MMTRKRWIPMGALAVAGLAAALLRPSPAEGQGWIDPPVGVRDWGVVKLRTDVEVRITGRVAQVEVEEWFENRGRAVGEGVYLYPLPGEAVFSSFSLYQGDQELRGETMDAEAARAIYEEIVRQRKDPALLELVGHGLVRARVFPIEAGQQRKVTLRYTQVLDRAGDAVHFRYAAGGAAPGVTPRPIPMPRPAAGEPGHGGVRRPAPDPAPIRFTLIADGSTYRDPFSPTHELRVDRRDGELRVRPEAELQGDFSVFLPLARAAIGLTLATHRPSAEPGYFMLTLSPGTVERERGTPRDVVAVVDVSGSMSGQKMEQTREALYQLIGSLSERDRFRLIAFSSGVTAAAEGWSRADRAGVEAARRWVAGLRAEGGTNIAGALEEAFRLESAGNRLPIVIFLTDGLPTVGEQDPERIAAAAERRRGATRVFAFGVGYDANTYLLDRLSAAGRGSTEYVEPGEDVEQALGTLAAKITHPVLTDVRIDDAPVRFTEIHPVDLPDLFAGEDMVVFGRYEGSGGGALRVAGTRDGRAERFGITADFPGHGTANDFIPRLWASRKLGELTRQVRLNGADPELVEEIRRTALRYGLLSEYTAYLVQEPLADLAVGNGSRALQLEALAVAAAPAAATGQAAVKASEAARARREVASAADLAVAEEAMEERLAGTGRRVVAGRTFEQRDGVWTEVGSSRETVREVSIRAYGAAYFELLRRAPELRPVVTELEPVVVRGARVAIRIGDEGRETLSAGEADRLVREFRGP